MAHFIPQQTHTNADELRKLLDVSYALAVNIKDVGPQQAQQLLENLDRISELFSELSTSGVDLRSEAVQWREVQGAVRRHTTAFRAELAPAGGLRRLREALATQPPSEHWWWWLDVQTTRAIRKRIFLTVAALVGAALLLFGGYWAFNKLFPTDPAVAAAYEHKLNADDMISQGDILGAVQELELAYAYTPDDSDILTTLAALYDISGNAEKAAPILDNLAQDYPPSIIHANVAQAYLLAGAVDKALPLALQAIREDRANPQAYLVAASAYEFDGEVRLAVDYYQKAADAANTAGEHQLEAFAKIRMANLLQRRVSPGAP